MSFHASRFDARQNENSYAILYKDQDESLWNEDVIAQGRYFLDLSAQANALSSYHLEAELLFGIITKRNQREMKKYLTTL